jgi:hypothetical protein
VEEGGWLSETFLKESYGPLSRQILPEMGTWQGKAPFSGTTIFSGRMMNVELDAS